MGRETRPLYKDPASKKFFARWYEDGKKYRLSLNTFDEAEAISRLPVVRQAKMSWSQYQTSVNGMSTMVINAVDQHRISPPLTYNANKEALSKLIESAVQTGNAFYDPSRGYWILTALKDGLPTDSTAMSTGQGKSLQISNDGLVRGLDIFKTTAIIDDFQEIEKFYQTVVPQLYLDKIRALRFSRIWLNFLKENEIISWNQITEDLLIQFKGWRKTTPVRSGRNLKCAGKPPSNAILNQHIDFLGKTFTEAIARGCMTVNPVRNWQKEKHITPPQDVLTLDELKKVLTRLTGPVLEIVLILFCACKRRKEITQLLIENINFVEHHAHYTEYKNSAKGIPIYKAFHLTENIELFLRKIIGERTKGRIWPVTRSDYVSKTFEEVARLVCPKKKVTLKSLRQAATDAMEKAGLTDPEIDAVLGHLSVSKALKFYKDRSPEAIARKMAASTRKGVEVLSETMKEFLR
ncbi:MAG: hypothetical protein JW925_14050 [Syntrophaceae bacterium]|nr:hypothetical protein [Syntrophaceae bacterium]